ALRRTVLRPGQQRVAIRVAETAIVPEVSDRRIGVPRRHGAVADLVDDRLRIRARVFVGEQRHRRDLALTMTARAVLVEDGRDVLRERRDVRLAVLLRLRLRRRGADRDDERGRRDEERAARRDARAHYFPPPGPLSPGGIGEATGLNRMPLYCISS